MCKNNHALLFLTSLAVIVSRELCCRHGSAEDPTGTNVAAWDFPARLKHPLFSFKPTLCHFGYVMTNNDEKLDCSRQSCSETTLRVLPHLPGGAEPLALKTKWHFNKDWIKHNPSPNGYSASLTRPAVQEMLSLQEYSVINHNQSLVYTSMTVLRNICKIKIYNHKCNCVLVVLLTFFKHLHSLTSQCPCWLCGLFYLLNLKLWRTTRCVLKCNEKNREPHKCWH